MKEKYAAYVIPYGEPVQMNRDLCKAMRFMLRAAQEELIKPTHIEASPQPSGIGIALSGTVGSATPTKEQSLGDICRDYLAGRISLGELADRSEGLGY